MYELQPTPGHYERQFDGWRQVIALHEFDELYFSLPSDHAWLRLRLGYDPMLPPRDIQISSESIVGGQIKLPLQGGWHSYFVEVQGRGPGRLTFTHEAGDQGGRGVARRLRPGLHAGLASLAVVDREFRERESAGDSFRSIHPAELARPALGAPQSESCRDSDLETVRDAWSTFGATDPLFFILTDKSKRNHQWNPSEFFATGRDEIDSALDSIDSMNISVRRRRALDFGCGVGRLAQALARQFDEVHGVDISRPMVDAAGRFNALGSRLRFHTNASENLELFPDESFDFVYSNIVLQHMHPRLARGYLSEFMRVLAPGGVLMFQLPSRPLATPQGLLLRVLPRRIRAKCVRHFLALPAEMEFNWIGRGAVIRHVTGAGGEMQMVLPDQSANGYAVSFRYCFSKPGRPYSTDLPRIASPAARPASVVPAPKGTNRAPVSR